MLPGVGNFDPAIRSIEKSAKRLDEAIDTGMPVMGICLGMEMLFDRSEEGKLDGLKILDGDVVLLPKSRVKIPQMGWNNLEIRGKSRLLKGVPEGSWVYFVHSYRAAPKSRKLVVATTSYGVSVPAVIERENLIGVQFHPEKSGEVGALMIKNFIEMCRNGSGKK